MFSLPILQTGHLLTISLSSLKISKSWRISNTLRVICHNFAKNGQITTRVVKKCVIVTFLEQKKHNFHAHVRRSSYFWNLFLVSPLLITKKKDLNLEHKSKSSYVIRGKFIEAGSSFLGWIRRHLGFSRSWDNAAQVGGRRRKKGRCKACRAHSSCH